MTPTLLLLAATLAAADAPTPLPETEAVEAIDFARLKLSDVVRLEGKRSLFRVGIVGEPGIK
jgi:hypothetical protein